MSISSIERSRLLSHARHIVETAKANGDRDLTTHEAAQVEADIANVKALDAGTKSPSLVERVMALGSSDDFDCEGNPRGAGLFSGEAKTGIVSAIKSRQAFRTELPAKAALTTGSLLPTSGALVQGGLHPNTYPLAALFQNVPAEGPTQRYYKMTSGSAAVVAEGALKPDAGVSITAVDLALAKIATTAQFSDEMAEDAPFLVQHLSNELTAAVLAAENAAILATFAGTSGIATASSTTAAVVDGLADVIASAEAVSGITPAAIVCAPSVVATIRKAKASTAGSYMVDPLTAGPTTIHGVLVITSPIVAATIAWVIEPSGVIVYRRGGLTVEVGTNA